MFCPKCGSDNEDTYKFCRICGTPLAGGAAAQEKQAQAVKAEEAARSEEKQETARPEKPRKSRPEEAPVYTSQPGFSGTAASEKKASVAERVVKAVRSPLTLLTILLYTAAIIFEIFSLITGGANVDTFISNAALSTSVDVNFTGLTIVGGIISNIPAILVCIGMWLVYGSALKHRPGEISTTGITIIKVITIIEFVLVCIGVALAIIVMLALAGGSTATFFDNLPGLDEIQTAGIAGAAAIVLLVVCAAAAVIAILFFVKLLGTLNWTKAQLQNRESRRCPSLYVAVIIFIMAACLLISLVTAAGVLSLVGTVGVPEEYSSVIYSLMPAFAGNIIVTLIQVVFYILAGLLILKLRKIRNEEL